MKFLLIKYTNIVHYQLEKKKLYFIYLFRILQDKKQLLIFKRYYYSSKIYMNRRLILQMKMGVFSTSHHYIVALPKKGNHSLGISSQREIFYTCSIYASTLMVRDRRYPTVNHVNEIMHIAYSKLTEEVSISYVRYATGRWPARVHSRTSKRADMIPLADLADIREVFPPIGPHLHQIPSWSAAVIDLPRREHAALTTRFSIRKRR